MKRKMLFMKYISFNMLSMVGLSCYVLADTLFIANGVGLNGLTALNLVLPIYNIIFGIGLLIGVGSATRFSILRAQQQDQEASKYFTHAMKLAIIIAIPIMIVGVLFPYQIVHFMGANQEVIDIAVTYLRTFIIFAPFFILQQIVVTFVRNDQNPKLASFAMLAGTLFNIVFDYILVFPCQLGMFGAALATGFSPIVTLIICSLHFIWKQNNFHYIKCSMNLNALQHIIKIGTPSFITELSGGIIIFIFNIIILSIGGNIAVASYGVISNLAIVVTSLYTGIAQGVQPLFSQSHGTHDLASTKAYLHYAWITALIVSCFVYFCIFFFPEFIVSIFNSENNATMAVLAIKGMKIYFTGFFFVGLNMISISYLASIERVKPSFLISILRGGVVIIPLVICLSSLFSLNGTWLSFPISEGLIMLLAISLSRKQFEKR